MSLSGFSDSRNSICATTRFAVVSVTGPTRKMTRSSAAASRCRTRARRVRSARSPWGSAQTHRLVHLSPRRSLHRIHCSVNCGIGRARGDRRPKIPADLRARGAAHGRVAYEMSATRYAPVSGRGRQRRYERIVPIRSVNATGLSWTCARPRTHATTFVFDRQRFEVAQPFRLLVVPAERRPPAVRRSAPLPAGAPSPVPASR